jgi:hypothetical protein
MKKKVEAEIKNGQKKMSKIGKPKKVSKKSCKFRVCDHNAAETEKVAKILLRYYFFVFSKK